MKYFEDLPTKKKKMMGILGITAVLGSWALVILAPRFGYSSIDVGFRLTVFYVVVWLLSKLYRKKRNDK